MRILIVSFMLLLAGMPAAGADDHDAFVSALAKRDCGRAREILEASPRASLLRGIDYEIGACAQKNMDQALAEYRVSARSGDNEGRYSFFVHVGQRGARNEPVATELWEEAWNYLEQAADAKHARACRAIADALQFGINGKKNERRSKQFRGCAK